jgi:hypothetical protein
VAPTQAPGGPMPAAALLAGAAAGSSLRRAAGWGRIGAAVFQILYRRWMAHVASGCQVPRFPRSSGTFIPTTSRCLEPRS